MHAQGHTRIRDDIDGLRAVAILSVLGFHAFGPLLPGGFVGVDIFFVISGYLISGILLRSLENNSFSILQFYSRRIRRVFPALALVLCATLLAGWYVLLPDEFERLGKEVAAGAGFVSNISFWKEAGYFDAASELKPLLHLWSLGVEEQFYLIWPVLLWFAVKRRINPLAVTLAILAASFVLNVIRVHGHEAESFFLLPARLWELAIGGAYAAWEAQRAGRAAPTVAGIGADVSSVAGFALLVFSIAATKSSAAFPGWWAVPPTLGSVLLIAAGPRALVNRLVLSARPMVFIGLISYPLYMWHWPLLSFNAIIGAPDGARPVAKAALLLIAGVLAWATYRFIERPVRANLSPLHTTLPLAAAVAAVGVVGFLGYRGIATPRSSAYGLDRIVEAADSTIFPGPHLQSLDATAAPLRRQGSNPRAVLFIGDSFIEQYYPRFDWLLEENPAGTRSVIFASGGGCMPVPKVRESHHAYCDGLLERAERVAGNAEVDAIVIGANWLGYFLATDPRYNYYVDDGREKQGVLFGSPGAALAFSELQSLIERFRAKGKAVYLILQSPNDEMLDPRGLIESRWGATSFMIDAAPKNKDALTRSLLPIDAELRRIAGLTAAHVIDPVDFLCPADCPVITHDGVPLYRDSGHMNPAYVRTDVRYLDAIVEMEAQAHP